MSEYRVYLTSTFEPTTKEKAELIKVVRDDGSMSLYHAKQDATASPPNTTKARDVRPAWTVEADLPPSAQERAAQPALFASLIAKWKALLLLDEWEITFIIKDDLPRVEQGIVVSFSEKRAEIELSSRLTAETGEQDISHELLHLVIYNENWNYDSFCDDMLTRKAISKEEYTALQESFNLAQNISIEHLKRIFAKAGLWGQ